MYKCVLYAGHQFTIYPLNCEKLNPQYKLNTTHVGRYIWSGQLYAVCCFEFKFGSPLCVNRLTDTRLSQPASKMKKKPPYKRQKKLRRIRRPTKNKNTKTFKNNCARNVYPLIHARQTSNSNTYHMCWLECVIPCVLACEKIHHQKSRVNHSYQHFNQPFHHPKHHSTKKAFRYAKHHIWWLAYRILFIAKPPRHYRRRRSYNVVIIREQPHLPP